MASQYLTRELVEMLGSKIVRGDTPSDGSLPIEADLAKEYETSRTVIREAIKMLTAKGLVGSRPRRGTYVEPESKWNILDPDVLRWILQRRFSFELMRDFLVVREGIEPKAAAAAALRQDKAAIAEIARRLDDMREAEAGRMDSLEADIAFHIAILHASGNRFFVQFSHVIETALRFSIRLTNSAKGVRTASVPDHEKIYVAIEKGDAKSADEAAHALLKEAIRLLDERARSGE
ncbi:FadR family transcriptional regulator [Altererythrobacter sp. BO-6]|uniref:FadR/GntR family transcriptional regulator n=1 Tax=Altererythrobacter sp. BO-6 TaxID=2604537 RepID=UPI0013E1E44C|nr:FadR/GntR family transcriptional regulator [Altererythrobacter sp. BO-6]QIG53525.1 FadR family transcriptional regulator [Altererythrobacter sp. BO-6]